MGAGALAARRSMNPVTRFSRAQLRAIFWRYGKQGKVLQKKGAARHIRALPNIMLGGTHKTPGLIGFLDVKRPLVRAFHNAKNRLNELIETGSRGAVRKVSAAYRRKLGQIQQRLKDRFLTGQIDSAVRAKGRSLARTVGVEFPGDRPVGHGKWTERGTAPTKQFGTDRSLSEAKQRLDDYFETVGKGRRKGPKGNVIYRVPKADRPQLSKLREVVKRNRPAEVSYDLPEATLGEVTEEKVAKKISARASKREMTRADVRVARTSKRTAGKRLTQETEKQAARRTRDFENKMISAGYLDRPPITRRRGRPKRREMLPSEEALSRKNLPTDITDPNYARKTGRSYIPARGPKKKTSSPWLNEETGTENMYELVKDDPKALAWAKEHGFVRG